MRKIIDECDPRITAREVMQRLIHEEDKEDLPLPEKLLDQEPPAQPNVYSDGSLKNPGVGPHWMVGGIGAWWPDRKEEDIPRSEAETRFTKNGSRKKAFAYGASSTTSETARRDVKWQQDSWL